MSQHRFAVMATTPGLTTAAPGRAAAPELGAVPEHPAAPEHADIPVPELPVPDLAAAGSAITVSFDPRVRNMVYYQVKIDFGMNAEGIKNIIRTLARMGSDRVAKHNASETGTISIVIVIQTTTWDHDDRELWDIPEAVKQVSMLLSLGCEALLFLPWAWGAKCIWDLVSDPTLPLKVREECMHHGTALSAVVSNTRGMPLSSSWFLSRPKMYDSYCVFDSLFPELELRKFGPKILNLRHLRDPGRAP